MITSKGQGVKGIAPTPEIIDGIESVIEHLHSAADCVFSARVYMKEIRNGDYLRGYDAVEINAETHEELRLALAELIKEVDRMKTDSGFENERSIE